MQKRVNALLFNEDNLLGFTMHASFQFEKIYTAWVVGGIPIYAVVAGEFKTFYKGLKFSAMNVIDNKFNNSIFNNKFGAEVAKDSKMTYTAPNVYKKESFILP